MSQKFIKTQNKNTASKAYCKYFAQAIYDGFDGVMPPLPSVEP